jgi:meso-butanediol dehydrogenase/(S,S)-butanediol dehydrogenase/diacetyl reductase
VKKSAIVTGAAGGIGKAIVARLVSKGIHVFAVDQSEQGLLDLRQEVTTGITIAQLDVSHWDEVNDWVNNLIETQDVPNYLVCAAGINPLTGSNLQISEVFYNQVSDINIKGTFVFCNAVLPRMAELKRGAIVNISSVSGLIGWGGSSAYASSKGAIISMTRSFATEYGKNGVRVNCVCPGSIRTPMVIQNLNDRKDLEGGLTRISNLHPLGRLGEPNEVATVVDFLLSDEASFVSGVALPIDGALSIS